jgi:cytochrome b561
MVAVIGSQAKIATAESTKPAKWRLKLIFWLDAALLVSVCALQTLHFTGLVLHEWLGLAVVPLIVIHLLLVWSWIAAETRRLLTSQSARARINYLLNLSLFAAVTAATYSGILISQRAIPALTGSKAVTELDYKWDKLHNDSAVIVVILTGLHLAINWDWALAAGKRIFRRFLRDRP